MKTMTAVLLLVCGVLLSWTNPAYAYLDPGSGSMLLQILLGGVAGLVVICKLYWHRLLVMLRLREEEKAEARKGDGRSEGESELTESGR